MYHIKSKKAEIPAIKTIIILLVTTLIFLTFTIILFKTSNHTIDDKKLETQIIVNKLFNSNCFSDEYGIINEDEFTSENLQECFKNLPSDLAFQVKLEGSNSKAIAINPTIFENKIKLCSLQSNLLCTDMSYPVTVKTTGGGLKQSNLRIQIIAN